MADFSIRSDSVNVEEIMRQIRARIRDKRGVDYTEQEIRDLAAVKLEKFLDPGSVRSDLLEQYRQLQQRQAGADSPLDEETLFGSPRPWVRRVRRLFRPVLKLFLNPVPLMRASRVNETMVRHAELFYELVHNLVVETTRLGIEVKNLKMRVESLSSRLDFDERRSRALEGVVQYRSAAAAPAAAPTAQKDEEEGADSDSPAARSRRRRRRRGRRGGGQRPASEEASGAQVRSDAQVAGEIVQPSEPQAPVRNGQDRSAADTRPRVMSESAPASQSAGAPSVERQHGDEAGHAQQREPGNEEPGG